MWSLKQRCRGAELQLGAAGVVLPGVRSILVLQHGWYLLGGQQHEVAVRECWIDQARSRIQFFGNETIV